MNSNVDDTEIRKFEDLAHRWWDTESEFKPLHDINAPRLSYIEQRVGRLAGKRVVDVGCGGGILAEAMARQGARVTGIDMGETPLAVARLHQQESGVDVAYRRVTAEALAAEEAGQYDVVTCMEMLEHVPDPGSVVRACAELAAPGGHVFFSTINRNLKAFAMAIVGAEYVLGILPKGTHQYDRLIRPSELARWVREGGLELREITGMHYNPFTRATRLGGNVDVNYLMHTQRNSE